MVIVRDVTAAIEAYASPSLAEAWDNSGLQLGSVSREVERILLAVDVTAEVVAQAVRDSYDLLLAHHPLIFHPLKQITEDSPAGRHVAALIRGEVTFYAAHTNLDRAPVVGTAVALADQLQLGEHEPLPMPEGTSSGAAGQNDVGAELTSYGRLCYLRQAVSAGEVAQHVAAALGCQTVMLAGSSGRAVTSVAIVPGSGGSAVAAARAAGAEVVITGELGHHESLAALDMGLGVITVGHAVSERPVLSVLAAFLRRAWPHLHVEIALEPDLTTPVPRFR